VLFLLEGSAHAGVKELKYIHCSEFEIFIFKKLICRNLKSTKSIFLYEAVIGTSFIQVNFVDFKKGVHVVL